MNGLQNLENLFIDSISFQVRKLKADKADKEAIKTAVDVLIGLKTKFKAESGQEHKPNLKPPTVAATTTPANNAGDQLNEDITAQGLKVRDLKTNKAEKADVTAAVAVLLELKVKYKAAVGKDWKPDAHQTSKAKEPSPPKETSNNGDQLNDEITAQGLKVRDLKSNKAEKAHVTAAVVVLLDLKAKYKAAVGKDWKPDGHQPSKAKESSPSKETSNAGDQLNEDIIAQGLKVRDLKSNKAEKADVTAAVAILLDLKAKYKAAVGKDWKPDAHQPTKAKEPSPPKETSNAGTHQPSIAKAGWPDQLNNDITAQGLKVRDLKSNKAEKADVTAAVAILLDLKAKYKAAVGKDWKPDAQPGPSKAKSASPPKEVSSVGDQLNNEITAAGNQVRDLKSKKAEKAEIDSAVAALLDLKAKYKAATGQDWKPPGGGGGESKKNESKKGGDGGAKKKKEQPKKEPKKEAASAASGQKVTR